MPRSSCRGLGNGPSAIGRYALSLQVTPESLDRESVAVVAGFRGDALEIGVVGILKVHQHPVARPVAKDAENGIDLLLSFCGGYFTLEGQHGILGRRWVL